MVAGLGNLARLSRWAWLGAALLCCATAGCTAVTNPAADGIPVRLLPPEIIGPAKNCYQQIPLTSLQQKTPEDYLLATGDVLGVYIDGFVGERLQPLPVQAAPLLQIVGQNRLPPASGYPIPVREDGTVALPAVPNIKVTGLTVAQARDAIRDEYIKKELILPNNDRILVTLLYPRHTQVLVFRQEATAFTAIPDGPWPISKRNTGHLVDLPGYENDVLHALARSGGLPDFDTYNEIIIYRDYLAGKDPKLFDKAKVGEKPPIENWVGLTTRIPMRLPQNAPLPYGPQDVVLRKGDVIFLEARNDEVFFTAGLLPPGRHVLPRDRDLDVIEAISMVRGPFYNGAFGGSNLSGTLIQPGLGNPSPSLLVVLRRVPGRGQIAIAVDLRSAMQHQQERIPIRAGDVLVLQEKPAEALTRYLSQTFFNFDIFYNVFNSSRGIGILDIAAPDRLPGRVGTLSAIP